VISTRLLLSWLPFSKDIIMRSSILIKKAISCLPNKDREIVEALEAIYEKVKLQEVLFKRTNNQAISLYIFETSDNKVKIGISANPLERIARLATGGGFHVTRSYVSQPMKGVRSAENQLLKSCTTINGEYVSDSFDEVVRRFESSNGPIQNRNFKLEYEFNSNDGPLYCSNGFKYKSILKAAKAFHVSPKEIHTAAMTFHPIKGHLFQSSIFSQYTEGKEQHYKKTIEANEIQKALRGRG